MASTAVDLDQFSTDEQLELLERIWDRLSRHPADIPVTDAQRRELDRRLDDLEKDIRDGSPLGSPWADVRERLRPS